MNLEEYTEIIKPKGGKENGLKIVLDQASYIVEKCIIICNFNEKLEICVSLILILNI